MSLKFSGMSNQCYILEISYVCVKKYHHKILNCVFAEIQARCVFNVP